MSISVAHPQANGIVDQTSRTATQRLFAYLLGLPGLFVFSMLPVEAFVMSILLSEALNEAPFEIFRRNKVVLVDWPPELQVVQELLFGIHLVDRGQYQVLPTKAGLPKEQSRSTRFKGPILLRLPYQHPYTSQKFPPRFEPKRSIDELRVTAAMYYCQLMGYPERLDTG